MINLLPEDMKQGYCYARRNTTLLHYITLFGFGLIGLVVISVAGVLYLMQATHTYSQQAVSIQQSLQDQKQTETEKQVQDMSSSLKLAVQVLSQEVLFSQLLKRLAVATPSNTSLSNLSISQLQGSVDITARTIDYRAATQLQVNLADPANEIFAKADIMSITCNSTSTGVGASKYPCTVVLRALFANNNPFLFINNKAKAAKS